MNVDVARYLPIGLVLGVIGYCLWPYLTGPSQSFNSAPADKSSEITKAMLTGGTVPFPKRDPFYPGKTAVSSRATASGKTVRGAVGRTAVVGNHNVDPFQGLVLEATCISPGIRLATINGRVYHQREAVRPAAAGAPTCVLDQVLHDRVVLKADGKTRELQYSNAPLKPQKTTSQNDN